ncbi:MAG: ATP-dependent sacrificial sulfur transferase LarE [Myxococcales bacterium]|nr:ATP-dependent sacrificial sulfur transferase LarE [Myxococcales bacterium]
MSVAVSLLTSELLGREQALIRALRGYKRVVVAFSGGVDSSYLAWAAYQALGEHALALTAASASLSQREQQSAVTIAQSIGIPHRLVTTDELHRPEYIENTPSRCYYCKDTLFDAASLLAEVENFDAVVDGFNADDMHDHRPGHQAAKEHLVVHPLADHQLSKADIRALSKRAGLDTWKKPQLACMSSRIPYGMSVTTERLSRVEGMEAALFELGLFDVRARLVRENDRMVRIEVGELEMVRVIEHRTSIVEAARSLGFSFVTLDLEGFRSGRMNEELVSIRPIGARPQ